MKTRQIVILIIVAVFVGLIGYQFSKGSGEDMKKEQKEMGKYVRVQPYNETAMSLFIYTNGRVKSARTVKVSAQMQGDLEQGGVELKPGVKFKKGQMLFRVNSSEARYMLMARKSAFANLVANALPDIKLDFNDQYGKWASFFTQVEPNKLIPDLPSIDSEKLKVFLSSRNILTEYFNIKSDEERLKKYFYQAPFNGSITAVYVEPGASVNPGTPLFDIIKASDLEIELPVESNLIHAVKIGNDVNLSAEGMKWKGKIARIADYINPNTQTIPVFVEIEENENALYNGMYLSATISRDSLSNAFRIPRRAVFNNNYVYTVRDSLLMSQKVNILGTDKDDFIINGLKAKELVVIEPVSGAKDSLNVIPMIP